MGIDTMEGITRAEEDLLYRTFGLEAEYLIDHAWGREPTTIQQIQAYTPKDTSLSSGQVLMRDYRCEEGLLIVKEMTDLLCLDLVERRLVTNSLSLFIGYSGHSLKPARGTSSMSVTTSSVRVITEYMAALYRRIVDPQSLIRRVVITFGHVMGEDFEQWDLFTDPQYLEKDRRIPVSYTHLTLPTIA